MKRPSILTLLILLSLLLSACGGDSSPAQPSQPPAEDAVISGTLTAAPGGDVAGTTIEACLEPTCETAEQTITVSQAGTSAPFTISDLQAGSSYTLQALQDTNADGVADAEEASGTAGPVVAPAQEVSLALQVASAPPPDEDPPTPEPDSDLQGTWSGSGARTDTNRDFDLALDVTQVDAASGSVEATATFSGAVNGSLDMSGTLDSADLSLTSSEGGFTFTIAVFRGVMVGQGSGNLSEGGETPIDLILSKNSDAPPEQNSDLQGTWSGNGARTDTDQGFDLTLDVTQVDAAGSSVDVTATFDGVVASPIDMSGTLDGTDLPLASDGGGVTFTTIVSSTTMVGRGLVNLRESGATPMIFIASKDSDAPSDGGDAPSGGSLFVIGQ